MTVLSNTKWFTRDMPLSEVKSPLHPRKFNQSGIASMAHSIQAVGLLHPIVVDDDGNLLAGQRRLAAYRLLKLKSIPARILSAENEEAELVTIEENAEREDWTELERIQNLARRKILYAVNHPSEGETDKNVTTPPPTFTRAEAKTKGVTERQIQRDAAIGENLDGEAAAMIADIPTVANSKTELKALADLPVAEQKKVAAAVASGKAQSVRAAKQVRAKAKPTEDAPKNGQQKWDARPFGKLESQCEALLRAIDSLNRTIPASKFHRDAIAKTKEVMTIISDWKRATKK